MSAPSAPTSTGIPAAPPVFGTVQPNGSPSRTPSPQAPRRRLGRKVVVAVVVGALITAAGYGVEAALRDGSESASGGPIGPGVVTVEVHIQHSVFDIPEDLQVVEGSIVRFEVTNDDPINHELVLGSEAVHRRHRTGTDRIHPPVPGEVSVAPGDTGLTFYEFETTGTVEYVCHLPGHEEFGMVGEIEVVPAPAS